jgi:hypothetical protein
MMLIVIRDSTTRVSTSSGNSSSASRGPDANVFLKSVIGSDEPSYFGFSWQAVPGGPPLEPKRCHAISVEARVRAAGGRVAWDSITATVRNEGTEPLTNVELFVSSSHDLDLEGGQDCQVHGFGARCPIGSLGRGESRRLRLVGLPRRAGGKGLITVQSKLSLRVVADEPLLLTRLGTKWANTSAGAVERTESSRGPATTGSTPGRART